MNEGMQGFLREVAAGIGEQWVDTRRKRSPATANIPCRRRSGNHRPCCFQRQRNTCAPSSCGQSVAHRAIPHQHGQQHRAGLPAPTSAGQVVVDLGYRMNRILQVNEETCYAELEPGVSFQMLHDELARRGNKLMVSATSGPPHGGIIGNALDRGAGYGPYFDHFGMLCGMEIVLGNGDVIRTGDGGLDTEDPINWHVSRFSSGPALDGLFAQSISGS